MDQPAEGRMPPRIGQRGVDAYRAALSEGLPVADAAIYALGAHDQEIWESYKEWRDQQPAATAACFHLGDLVSVTTGRLVSPSHIGGVYAVVDHVTGQAHMTHQLPRACREVTPWLHEQHPWLADIVVPDWVRDEETVTRWLTEAVAEHGEHHEVQHMPFGAYVGREPIAELREMAPHAQIISVEGSPAIDE